MSLMDSKVIPLRIDWLMVDAATIHPLLALREGLRWSPKVRVAVDSMVHNICCKESVSQAGFRRWAIFNGLSDHGLVIESLFDFPSFRENASHLNFSGPFPVPPLSQ